MTNRDARLNARARLERLLSIVPWVAAQDGVPIAEISRRFDYPEDRLLSDLEEIVFMVGVYPFSPDQLIEVMIDDGMVWIRYADFFGKSLRLTPDQALALVTAGSSLLAVPGAEPDGALARGLAKLAAALGLEDGVPVGVRLGGVDEPILTTLRAAAAANHELQIDYYSYGRDERSSRIIEPNRVFLEDGQWYVDAYCHKAQDIRVFRADRIRSTELTGRSFVRNEEDPTNLRPSTGPIEVTLLLQSAGEWIASAYPCRASEMTDDGFKVTLGISAFAWLDRLLLQLGPAGQLLDVDGVAAPDRAAIMARKILERYRTNEG